MNLIDLVVCLALAVAVLNGARQGFIVQVCSLAGVAAGIWLGWHYGGTVGEWLRLDGSVAAPGGFVVVLVVVTLVVSIAARLLRKAFHFAGFGIPDRILGVAVAVVKYLLFLSVLFSAFDKLNEDYTLVEARTVEKSKTYKPIMRISETVFPYLKWIGDQVPQRDEEKE